MIPRSYNIAVLSLVFLGACVPSVLSSRANATPEASLALETRVYYGPCVFQTQTETAAAEIPPAVMAVFAAVLPGLISNTLDRFGTALRQAGEEETTALSAIVNFDLPIRQVHPCIQVIRGSFASSGDGAVADALEQPEGAVFSEDGSLHANLTRGAGIHLSAVPAFFLESRIRVSNDRTALAIAPVYLSYAANLKRSRFSPSGAERGLAIQYSFHAPGKAADDESSRGTTLTLGNMRPNLIKFYFPPELSDIGNWQAPIESPWFPAYSTEKSSSLVTAGKLDPDNKAPGPIVPFTITATLAETRDANVFILTLADVFDVAKPVLQEQAELALLEERRREAEATARKAEYELKETYYTDFVEAKDKVATYCNESQSGDTLAAKRDRRTKAKDAHLAQLRANASALSAGEDPPFDRLVSVTDQPVPVSGACA